MAMGQCIGGGKGVETQRQTPAAGDEASGGGRARAGVQGTVGGPGDPTKKTLKMIGASRSSIRGALCAHALSRGPFCPRFSRAPLASNIIVFRAWVWVWVCGRAVLKGGFGTPTETNLHGDALCFMGKTWARHGQDMGKTWARHGQDMGKTWARHGQDMGKTWARNKTTEAMVGGWWGRRLAVGLFLRVVLNKRKKEILRTALVRGGVRVGRRRGE